MRAITSLLGTLLLAACVSGDPPEGSTERFPTSNSYPAGTMERVAFTAAVPEGWRISALETPPRPQADWKIVIVTGTPSWSEYWAPTIAALPLTREMVVADRPGFRSSQPEQAVRDITKQAEALSPMLAAREGQRVLLVGQSFGAPVAALMAARYPDQVDAVLLMSPYFGDRGPTARRLITLGSLVQGALPRDLRNSIAELRAQRDQLPEAYAALQSLRQPVLFVHGDADTFVPLTAAEQLSADYHRPLVTVPGGDHFLNACCVPSLLDAMERAIAEADAAAAH